MQQALYFIIKTITQLYLLVLLLRLWLPLLRADFRNPLAQGILRSRTQHWAPAQEDHHDPLRLSL